MKDFLILLGWLSLAGSLLGLAVTAVGRWSKGRMSRAFCCGLWVLVLLRLALPVGAPEALGGYAPFLALRRQLTVQLPDAAAPAEGTVSNAGVPENSLPAKEETGTDRTPQAPAAQPTPPQSVEHKQNLPASDPETLQSAGSAWPQRVLSVTLTQALFAVWAAGAVLRFAWKLLSYRVYRRRLLQWAVPAPQEIRVIFAGLYGGSRLRLVCSPEIHTVLLLGVKDPVLVLPQPLPAALQAPDAIRAALCHELTHYRRGDLWLKWAAELVCSLHWFNPLVLLIRYELNRACELACDEAVISTMNAAEKQTYGETLLALAGKQNRSAVPLTAICEYKHQLKERLVCIMTYKKRNLLSVIACCCLLALLCGCAAALGPAEEAPDAPPAESAVTETVPENTEQEPAPESETATDPYAFDAEALHKTGTVAEFGEIRNEFIKTERILIEAREELDWIYNRSLTLTGGRLWVTGYKSPEVKGDPAPRKVLSFNPDGSDVQVLTLTVPARDETVFGPLPEGHEWRQFTEMLVDYGEAQPRVLRSITKYGPDVDGFLNPLGDGASYISQFDENGVLDEGIRLDIDTPEGMFLDYLCSTPGKLWFGLNPLLGLGDGTRLLSFSMEDGSLLDDFLLPDGSYCPQAQGLADGRVTVFLANGYPTAEHSAGFHSASYRLVVADPATGTLGDPVFLPYMGQAGTTFEPLLRHALCELPANPTVRHYSLYELDLATNKLIMLADNGSFNGNVSLELAVIIPRADGSFLIMENDSFRILNAEPYPLEG